MADPQTTTDVILVHLEYLRNRADETTERLAQLNNRTRKSEVSIAVLQWALGLVGIVATILLTAFIRQVWP